MIYRGTKEYSLLITVFHWLVKYQANIKQCLPKLNCSTREKRFIYSRKFFKKLPDIESKRWDFSAFRSALELQQIIAVSLSIQNPFFPKQKPFWKVLKQIEKMMLKSTLCQEMPSFFLASESSIISLKSLSGSLDMLTSGEQHCWIAFLPYLKYLQKLLTIMFWEKIEIPSCVLVPPGSVGFAGPAGGSYPTTKSIVAYREIHFFM